MATVSAFLGAGCSVYMEATRPTPVSLAQFQAGQTRDYVLEQLGTPPSSAFESDGALCDFYKLYTRGYGAGGKIPIAITEGAADVVTLGLAEVVTTPVEGVTKNELHPVTFCYRNNLLVRMIRSASPGEGAGVAASGAPSPAALPDSSDPAAGSVPDPWQDPPPPPASAATGADGVPDRSPTE